MSGGQLVSIAVSVGLDRVFSYRWPQHFEAQARPGERVLVPFGSRVLVGVVRPVEVDLKSVEELKVREVLERLDAAGPPTLGPDLVDLCEWISRYYVAPVGEAYRLVLPGLLANADARRTALTDAGRQAIEAIAQGPLLARDLPELSKHQVRLLQGLADAPTKGMPVAKLTRLRPRVPAALTRLAELAELGLCRVDWEDAAELSGRREAHYRRTSLLRGRSVEEPELKAIVGRSKQRRALLDHLESAGDDWISAGELRGAFPRVTQLVPPLIEGGLIKVEERARALNPFDAPAPTPTEPQTPTADQSRALGELRAAVGEREFASFLLHGITGSGKTEVYLQTIAAALDEEEGAIVLVPEIALTPQLADRFRARFGERVAVLHSGLTPRQRLDAWDQIRRGERSIVIGPRSALFAPLARLRVIVVDEEHDASFKQEEGVRYSARDLAMVRGRNSDAIVILGSATPSLESYALAKSGRHRYLRLQTRPTPRPLPEVELLSLAVHRPDSETMMSATLRKAVLDCVEAGDQAILFLNRRGYTASMTCLDCGALQGCPDCSAPSMTYHLERNRLMCHLCGYIADSPRNCLSCKGDNLVHGRGGTERVEVALAEALPGVRVLRLDRDTSRGRKLLEVLAQFRAREADVLVGTQMLSKGHDFPGVTLVGILQGDHALGLPDPRASERTFQLLTQVAGRAGRGDKPGRVLIQTWTMTHPALVHAQEHDFDGFAVAELKARAELGNPPSGHLALVRINGRDPQAVRARAHELAQHCRAVAAALATDGAPEGGESANRLEVGAVQVLGPVPSPMERINQRIRWQLLLRGRSRSPLRQVLHQLRPLLGTRGRAAAETRASADVDPQSFG